MVWVYLPELCVSIQWVYVTILRDTTHCCSKQPETPQEREQNTFAYTFVQLPVTGKNHLNSG